MFDLITPWTNSQLEIRGGTNNTAYLEWVLASAQDVFDGSGRPVDKYASVQLRQYLDAGGVVAATFTVSDWVLVGVFRRNPNQTAPTYQATIMFSHQIPATPKDRTLKYPPIDPALGYSEI
jgi:hypothetical protein